MDPVFDTYEIGQSYDEYFEEDKKIKNHLYPLVNRLAKLGKTEILRRQTAAESLLLNLGVTFNVTGDSSGPERIFPMDILPRLIELNKWKNIEKGLRQRTYALNEFIQDIYNNQNILKDRIIPPEVIYTSPGYKNQCRGVTPPGKTWIHVGGMDMVSDEKGNVYVLEDNLRCPSGVSYVLENRQVMKRTLPQVFEEMNPLPVEDYPIQLLETLRSTAPNTSTDPCLAVLTPGIYNSAYFEHSFLAQQMGVELVTGDDLFVENKFLFMRTTRGPKRIDVLYRRIDDDFLDPRVFRPDSMLGVPGIMECFTSGNLTLANAPGTGIADDKVIYAYIPEIIKYYLGEDQILPNVPTYLCQNPSDYKYVLENMDKLVIKSANESGGYGVLIGPHASKEELAKWKTRVQSDPRNYLAQVKLNLSMAPCIIGENFEPRHIDLRPFILFGKEIFILPGGLTRVALRKGSLIVNSSQGGGSKDTWVVEHLPTEENDA